MRIAIFTESYEPVVNGVSVSVATLRDGLRSRGHEVFIFAPRFRGYKDKPGDDVYRFPSTVSRLTKGYPVPIPYSLNLRKVFSDIRPDIVHTQTPFFLGMTGMKWARSTGTPIVSTNHTIYTEYLHYVPLVPKQITRSVLLWHMRRYYNKCSALIVPSQPVMDMLREYNINTRIEVIKTGVTVRGASDGDMRKTFGIPEDAFVLLYVGRIAREKNLGLLLRTFKSVHDRHPETCLVIAGSGPYEQTCRDIARHEGLKGAVVFTGMVSPAEVGRMYRAADAFVFPSVTETQGLVVCEALMAGLPCVAVGAAGIPEVVEDGVDGLLTDNSISGFADAMNRLINEPGLKERLSTGAIRNSVRFTPMAMAERIEAFYQSEIERGRGKVWKTSCSL